MQKGSKRARDYYESPSSSAILHNAKKRHSDHQRQEEDYGDEIAAATASTRDDALAELYLESVAQEEEELNALFKSALHLQPPCLVCDAGDLIFEREANRVKCDRCAFQITEQVSLDSFRDRVSRALESHALDVQCGVQRPAFLVGVEDDGTLTLSCEACAASIPV